jgi:predicted metal-binding membrane protein
MSDVTLASSLETVLKRDRVVVFVALGVVVLLSWAWVLAGAGMGMTALEMTRMTMVPAGLDHGAQNMAGSGNMTGMAAMAMQPATWGAGYAVLMFFMWWIMMIAMMLPSAAPMILLYAMVSRKRAKQSPHLRTFVFALAYLVVWAGFSLVAVAAQWGLERTGLVSSMMASTSAVLGGTILVAAGLWQLTPIKQACLRHCRSPIFFIAHHWKPGTAGAFRMGLEHGVYCAGCCWFLMALLFVGGVMNLLWIGGLALFVLLEKTVPAGHWLARASGVLLILAGSALAAGTIA